MPNSSRSNGARGITDRDPSSPRETIESMATEAEQLYNWILIANEARERLDLPVGTIEEAMATLQTAFGASYLASLIPSDQEPGTLGIAAGVSVKVISDLLGHASISFTLERYSHVLPSIQDEAAAKVERLLVA
jgi:hypothetical protein